MPGRLVDARQLRALRPCTDRHYRVLPDIDSAATFALNAN